MNIELSEFCLEFSKLGGHIPFKLAPGVGRSGCLLFWAHSPLVDLQVVLEIDLVLGFGEPLKQRIYQLSQAQMTHKGLLRASSMSEGN